MLAKIVACCTLFLIALWIACCGGCSDREKLVDVSGKVTYNGKVTNMLTGEIAFLGPAGVQAFAKIGSDGTYHANNVSCGMNRVAVYYRNPLASLARTAPSRHPKPGEPTVPIAKSPPFLTPEKYASVDTSGLSVEVNEGKTFNVDMIGPTNLGPTN